jgi:soluble lytic murein transglycosylase-like protein
VSIADAVQRVAQLQALVHGGSVAAPAAAPVPAASPTGFAPMLAQATAAAAGAPPAAEGAFSAEIAAAAARNGIDPRVLREVVRHESGFNPSARSPAGALGLTQLMPATAAGLGVTNPLDPAQSLEGGAKYLRQQLDHFGGDLSKALAAYNAGPGAVERFGGVPPYAETQKYVQSILAALQTP